MTARMSDDAIFLLWELGDISEGQAVMLLKTDDRLSARQLRDERLAYIRDWMKRNIDWQSLKDSRDELRKRAQERTGGR